MQVYDQLEGQIPVVGGNARDIKAVSHKKINKVDVAWIASWPCTISFSPPGSLSGGPETCAL